MKIYIAKFVVKQGKYEYNYQKIKTAIMQAKAKKYDAVVFQSSCIAGVFFDENIKQTKQEICDYNQKIHELAKGIYVIWGNIDEDDSQSLFVAKDDFIIKVEKPVRNDRFYNEDYIAENLFAEIDEQFVVGFGKQTISDKFHILFDTQEKANTKFMIENGVYINHFGVENINKSIVIFDGKVLSFKQYHPEISEEDLNEKGIDIKNITTSQSNLFDSLIFALREFNEQVFANRFKWVVGLSGGLDSSVSVALLTYAFGKENVIGYNMATKNNTTQTISIAKKLANTLGIAYHEGNITPLIEATEEVLQSYGYQDYSDLTRQNIQARLRGHLLSSFAAIENAVIVNNGNKVETALGYATLYGDMVGAISPIADLTKVQLFDLAKEINAAYGKEVIPQALLPQFENDEFIWQQKPSAELAQGQFDPMKWFYHDYLVENLNVNFTVIEFMQQYLNNTIPADIYKWMQFYGLDNPEKFIGDLDWVVSTMERNKFKLLQAPPIISVSNHSFGSDIPVIQTKFDNRKYIEYKNKILKK